MRLCALLSGSIPAAVANCARSALQVHIASGYAPAKMVLIPNGIDTSVFAKNEVAGLAFREAYGIPSGAFVVGWTGRLHPIKDPKSFLDAVAMLSARHPEAWFLVAGSGMEAGNPEVSAWLDGRPRGRLLLLGRQRDMKAFYSAVDLLVSSSKGEALPLAVAEGMACSLPCVVTDVGDSRELVGDTGDVVPPGEPEPLARTIEARIMQGRAEAARAGEAARSRIEARYSFQSMIRGYLDLYARLKS